MKKASYIQSGLRVNASKEGERLETKIERLVTNKEPIKDGAPLLYTERKQGILASTNIRTDRFDVALDAMDKVAKSYKSRRENKPVDRPPVKKDGEAEPTQGKQQSSTDGGSN